MSRYVIPKSEDSTPATNILRIFISHSHDDRDLVAVFNDNILQLGMGIHADNIFCTSFEGTGIKSDEQWVDRIKKELKASTICIFIVTPNFLASKTCLNEMGAAWVLEKKVVIFTVSPLNHEDIGDIYKMNQIEKMNDGGLNNFFDTIRKEYPHLNPTMSIWDKNKKTFLSKIRQIIDKYGSPMPYSKTKVDAVLNENIQLKIELEKMKKEIEQLRKCKDSVVASPIEIFCENTAPQNTFEKLLDNAKEQLQKVSSTLRTVIYNHRYNQSLDIRFFVHELSEEEAKKYVIIDENECTPVYEKKEMQAIKNSLDTLEHFIDELTPEEYDLLEKRFQTLDCTDLDFWKNVLHISMNYA